MGYMLSFRFVDEALNRRLIGLLKKSRVKHSIGEAGVIHYSAADVDLVENDLICSIRTNIFPTWKVLTCPIDWAERYRRYMVRHNIPFQEELATGELWFLIPSKYRPHSWKLEEAELAKSGKA
jgi:hypothetical protein